MFRINLIFGFFILLISSIIISGQSQTGQIHKCDVLVVGGGTSGIAAGIQSARLGTKTIIVEPISWLGGMLSAAGVSATDGNHRLPSGIWQEFREEIYKHYGGPEAVATGWVSNTHFEPHVADSIFKTLAKEEKNLTIIYNSNFLQVIRQGNKVIGARFINKEGNLFDVTANIVIDATELGDVFSDAGAKYDVGMEAKAYTGEEYTVEKPNDIIQDLTYTAILKDYSPGIAKAIPRPASYDSSLFMCSCKWEKCSNATSSRDEMLSYAKLPNNKYLINWPEHGNDIYLNAIEMNFAQREKAYQTAKQKTLAFIYFMQNELGYRNLGLAEDEFPTEDKLPLIPYNREGRRIRGIVRFTLNSLMYPYSQPDKLYRTVISVGDYPVDHHSFENPNAPQRKFPNVPSFGIPLGCLIPENVDGLIVAEKGISVSNIVNGATRLQPCVMLTGQAAGTLAAYCSQNKVEPANADIRKIQKMLLESNAYLLPFIDVSPVDPDFKSIQRIGVTGIIQGVGVPYNWANQTWFYPERLVSQYELIQGLRDYYNVFADYYDATGEILTIASFVRFTSMTGENISLQTILNDWEKFNFKKAFNENIKLDRRMAAVLLDYYLHPFDKPIDFTGKLKSLKHP